MTMLSGLFTTVLRMLPSKGYFCNHICPYNGKCARPYCHYRHRKNENYTDEDKVGENIKQLVKETVNKVLLSSKLPTGVSNIDREKIIENVLKEIEENRINYRKPSNVPSYNPTPIAQLNRKHIPVAIPPSKPTYSKSMRPNRYNPLREQVTTRNKYINNEKNAIRSPSKIFKILANENKVQQEGQKENVPEVNLLSNKIQSFEELKTNPFQENENCLFHEEQVLQLNASGVSSDINKPINDISLGQEESNTTPGNDKPIVEKIFDWEIDSNYKEFEENASVSIESESIQEKKACMLPNMKETNDISSIIRRSNEREKRKFSNEENDISEPCEKSVWQSPNIQPLLCNGRDEAYFNEEFPPLKKIKGSSMPAFFPSPTDALVKWGRVQEIISGKKPVQKLKINPVPNVQIYLSGKEDTLPQGNHLSQTQSHGNRSLSLLSEEKEFREGKQIVKTIVRKAHVPGNRTVAPPAVLFDPNTKIPHSIRQSSLNKMFDEFCKHIDYGKAKESAQKMEWEICRRLYSIKPYKNAIAMALLRIRKQKGILSEGLKPEVTLKSDSIPPFTNGWALYTCFTQYILSDNEYKVNGFPIKVDGKSGYAYIEMSARRNKSQKPNDTSQRNCDHCSKTYYVNEEGFPVKEYDCIYHWGKLRRMRVCGNLVERYSCCDGDIDTEPCTTGRYHVCNVFDEDSLEGFVSTRPQEPEEAEEKAGIFGLDCEMCYTTKGIELTRCTLVDLNGNTVYDKVVMPDAPIIDYCTRFSGITEESMKGSTFKLRDIQRDLLSLVNENTIIVGHSLENDLKVLRIFHRTLVDTSVVFPHSRGLPYKNSLKRIAKDLINLSIQESENGHDSYEDANACVQLMLWKIKEDAKKRKPRVIISLEPKEKNRR